MLILGIETSCDETAAAVVENGAVIYSNVVATSLKEHSQFGGVIPEIASRRQLEYINKVTSAALDKAGVALNDIDAIAVTQSPGLIGSLLVGVSFAQALGFALSKPCISVDHIKSHIYANYLSTKEVNRPLAQAKKELPFPAIGLVVSGGHTSLYLIKSLLSFEIIGSTRDDAAGEAFDKVARLLELGYPGGPIIDKFAQKGKPTDLKFPEAKLKNALDFSFSGVKTAVLYYVRGCRNKLKHSIEDVAFAFQDSVARALINKCFEACRQYKAKTLLIGGGVAANSFLRNQLIEKSKEHKIKVSFPAMSLCVDNAAMIAGYGFHLAKRRKHV